MKIKAFSRRTISTILLTIVVIIGIFLGFRQFYNPIDFEPQNFSDFLKQDPTEDQVIEYTENLKEIYQNDTYGGATPRETMDLFIKALEDGDVELASKYFIPEKQGEMYPYLKESFEKGGAEIFLETVSRVGMGKGFNTGDGRYQIEVKGSGEEVGYIFGLVKNPYKELWKLESL